MSGNDTSCSSVWRQAREGSPSGWTSPPRAACSPRPKAERIPLIVQEQRGIIKHPPSPRPALVIAVLQESKLIQSPDGALDLPLLLYGQEAGHCGGVVGRPHLFKRLLLNHQVKPLLLLSGGAGGDGMVSEASFYPPRTAGDGSHMVL